MLYIVLLFIIGFCGIYIVLLYFKDKLNLRIGTNIFVYFSLNEFMVGCLFIYKFIEECLGILRNCYKFCFKLS